MATGCWLLVNGEWLMVNVCAEPPGPAESVTGPWLEAPGGAGPAARACGNHGDDDDDDDGEMMAMTMNYRLG